MKGTFDDEIAGRSRPLDVDGVAALESSLVISRSSDSVTGDSAVACPVLKGEAPECGAVALAPVPCCLRLAVVSANASTGSVASLGAACPVLYVLRSSECFLVKDDSRRLSGNLDIVADLLYRVVLVWRVAVVQCKERAEKTRRWPTRGRVVEAVRRTNIAG